MQAVKRVMLIGALLSTSSIVHAQPSDAECKIRPWTYGCSAAYMDAEIEKERANAKPQVHIDPFIPNFYETHIELSDKIIPKIIADAYQCRLNNIGCDTTNERIDAAKVKMKPVDYDQALMFQLNAGINGHIDYDPTMKTKVAALDKQNQETSAILCMPEQKQLHEVYSKEARFDGTRNYVVQNFAPAAKYLSDFGVRNLQIMSRGKTPAHTCAEALNTATDYMLHDPDTD
jgi:hypothetical protein